MPGFVLVDRATEPRRETPSSLAGEVGLGVLGVIPPAPLAMYQANVSREPLYLTDPECETAQAYRALGEVLLTQPIEAPSGMRP